MILFTNNPKVQKDNSIICIIEYVDGTYGDVLIAVRDRIHKGHRLLSHPLSGSVKPGETPYKSVLVSKGSSRLDPVSLNIIEESIATYHKFMKDKINCGHHIDEETLEDFKEIDYTLILSAVMAASNYLKI